MRVGQGTKALASTTDRSREFELVPCNGRHRSRKSPDARERFTAASFIFFAISRCRIETGFRSDGLFKEFEWSGGVVIPLLWRNPESLESLLLEGVGAR